MAVEQSILVDENDNVIGYKDRSSLTPNDRFRMCVIWLEDDKGNVLIHKRSKEKVIRPGIWENAAGGGVSKGESYEEAAYKELSEELGITDVQLNFVAKNIIRTSSGERYCAWFKGVTNKKISELHLPPREVEEARWVDKTWLLNDRDKHPDKYMPSSAYWRKLFS